MNEKQNIIVKINTFNLINFIGTCVFTIGLTYFSYINSKNINLNYLVVIHILVSGKIFYDLLFNQIYELDMLNYRVHRKNLIWNYVIKSIDIQWNPESIYLYTMEYDSYKNISAVWFCAKVENNTHKLIKFNSLEKFEKFKQEFEEKYPEHKINEWYE